MSEETDVSNADTQLLIKMKNQLDEVDEVDEIGIPSIPDFDKKNVKKTKRYETIEEYVIEIRKQNLTLRRKILEAITGDIENKNIIRESTLKDVFLYLKLLTIAVLLLIVFGKCLGIGNNVELALIGTVLGSVISTIVLFCKYAFSDSTNLIDLFLNLSEGKKDSTNKK